MTWPPYQRPAVPQGCPASARHLQPLIALLATLLLLFSLPSVAAQSDVQSEVEFWTVQTAAFQDYRQALAQIEQLRDLHFDAYSEFSMNAGVQYARVRIGCFASREAAAAFAGSLAGVITADAVAQPMSEGARVTACTGWDIGFVKPVSWSVERIASDIVFRVELAGHVGFLQHDGNGWGFMHELPAPADSKEPSTSKYRQSIVAGQSYVQARVPGGNWLNSCDGKLLWQRADVAVVERSTTVIACVVDER